MKRKQKKVNALKNQSRRIRLKLESLQAVSRRYSWIRFLIFITGLVLTIWLSRVSDLAGLSVLAVSLVVFNIVACFHRQIEASIRRHEIYLKIKKTQVARATLKWEQLPDASSETLSSEHPFETDLDITGRFSLHRLLDTTISREGSRLLLDWLLTPSPDMGTIKKRQSLIRELTPLAIFRDKLLLRFQLFSEERLNGKKVIDWLNYIPDQRDLKLVLPVSSLLAVLNIAFLILHQAGLMRPWWIISFGLYVWVYLMNRKSWSKLLDETIFIDNQLRRSVIVFKYLEKYPYSNNAGLKELCRPFWEAGSKPTALLRKMMLICMAVGLRSNYLLGLILNILMPWDFFFADRLNRCKLELGRIYPKWLELCNELEALIALANFAYLNPDNAVPDIETDKPGSGPLFSSRGLGHPLIPDDQRVCNDFHFDELSEIALVTGSNMSGKSTFLKTVGINLCLAYSGTTVNASGLKTSLFRIFTCIKVNDSLSAGISQFYAEVKRLKLLMELIDRNNELPLFYLVDEIYKGTNNRERLIGSRSFIQALGDKRGVGIISTHDLELTKLVADNPRFSNHHFREEIKDGRMVFDYILRPGPCPTTNALKIMKLEGLPVDAGS